MNEMFAAHETDNTERLPPLTARGGWYMRGRRWAALLDRVAAGDVDALGVFYDESSSLTFGLVMYILQDREAAEDVLVDVYREVRDQAQSSDAKHNTVSWLLGLARRTALTRLQRSGGARASIPLPSVQPAPTTSVLPFELFHRERRQVRRALDRLTPRQRTIVQMTYFGGLRANDVACELKLPPQQVMSEIRLAMWTLKSSLTSVDAE
jgi:RNA polymerase sigma-70 factor (ECF subfamily)